MGKCGLGLAVLAVCMALLTGLGKLTFSKTSKNLLVARNFLLGVLLVGFGVGNFSWVGIGG